MPLTIKPRAVAFLALAVLAGSLACAGVAVPYTMETEDAGGVTFKSYYTLWEMCGEGGGAKVCVKLDDAFSRAEEQNVDLCGMHSRFRAMRAFGILTILVAFLGGGALGAVDLLNLPQLPADKRKLAMAAVGGVVAFFSLITWAIFAGTWNMECNGGSLADSGENIKWGAGAPLMIVTTVLGIALAVVAMVLPGADGSENADGGAATVNTMMQPIMGQPVQKSAAGARGDDMEL